MLERAGKLTQNAMAAHGPRFCNLHRPDPLPTHLDINRMEGLMVLSQGSPILVRYVDAMGLTERAITLLLQGTDKTWTRPVQSELSFRVIPKSLARVP